jgi:hypothetical protein
MSCHACQLAQRPCDGTCDTSRVERAATTFGTFAKTRLGTRPQPRLTARTRPAGDAEPAARTTNTAAATNNAQTPAAQDAARTDAGLQVGRQVLTGTTDTIAREQERARQEQEQRARERLAQIESQREIELARIRANAQSTLAQREAATSTALAPTPRTEFSVLGLEASQNVNARPAANAQSADSGVLAWVKENPVPTAIGAAIVIGGVVYLLKQSKKRRSR